VTLAARLRAPGWYRAALSLVIGFGAAAGIVVAVRTLYGFEPTWDGNAVTTVSLIAMPLAFLLGIGCFDYWFYWAAGRPTRPEHHTPHRASSS